MKNVHLLIIDPQNDFCDPSGSLYVPGALADMLVLSEFIKFHQKQITRIFVTLDQHHLIDVAHPAMWRDKQGNHPAPFTIISSSDIKNNVWTPVLEKYPDMLSYAEALEAQGKYPLCIWPPHCLIGTSGANVYPSLMSELNKWSEENEIPIEFVFKGMNIYTEHYSAIAAEVVDDEDPATHINYKLLNALLKADRVLVAGEALSHCVANTVRDLVDYGIKPTLLTDTTSSVPNCEELEQKFIVEMISQGMKTINTTEYIS